ncbi:glycoside hydrolase family 3 protein [Patellaria atrata CBS 101060]|uniref:Probable beta-glucosidase E n=1 Tax=Patellaria atrata CBS 101060 TaxID=1346257 RepID=A0A9P4SDJ4_9PEZI|nr:glycoside hydrolase family 3 protein [Patellaria atrata CBS 101060]
MGRTNMGLHHPKDESYELRGKYSKIDRPSDSPLRSSLDAAYRHSSDSEFEDLDEFDPLNYDEGTLKRRKTRSKGERLRLPSNSSQKNVQRPYNRLRRWLIPSRMCCWLTLLFTASLILLLSAGGIWAYKSAPEDGQSPPWYPSPKGGTDGQWAESYRKAAELVRQMTLVEKVNITTGTGWAMDMCVGNTGQVARLGFPALCLQDGPLGIRFADNITAFPAGITVGSTWNRELMYARGRAHAAEAKGKGVNVLLGPAMGPLGRLPAGGRNWEGFGTDPVLQGVAAAQTIRGIQDEGIIATAKHFIGNEQEHFRQSYEWGLPNAISSNIDDRTLHELYTWPFAESVRAGVASVMCSYNQVNNSYACGNSKLLNGILKDELGFQGFVQSDWLAQRSGVSSALAGLDMSMPGDGLKWQDGKSLWGQQLTKAVLNTSVPVERLNDMVTRVVAAWYHVGQDDKDRWPLPAPDGDGGPNFSSWTDERIGLLHPSSDDKATGVVNQFINVQGEGDEAHGNIARKIAVEGHILLKNEGDILPLNRTGWNETVRQVKNTPFRVGIFGEDARGNVNGPNACKDRACNEGTLASGWGSGAVEFPYLITPLEALKSAFDNETVYVTDLPQNKIPDASAQILEDQDLCFVFIDSDGGEGYVQWNGVRGDRNDLYAQKNGDDLVLKVAAQCGNGEGDVIVVIHSIGPVIMEKWIDLPNIKAVILANLPGQESGNALVDILFGDVNPSGHLPYTIGKDAKDYGPDSGILRYPNGIVPQQNFTEGLYIDYRYFDKHNITPRYEFGHGLSYTQFHLSSLMVQQKKGNSMLPEPRPTHPIAPPKYDNGIPNPETAVWPEGFRRLNKYIYPYIDSTEDIRKGKYPYPIGYNEPAPLSPAGGGPGGNPSLYDTHAMVSVTLTNVGGVPKGAAVVQLYVGFPEGYKDPDTQESVDFPVRVLRNFTKIEINGNGERSKVSFDVSRKDLSYWDTRRGNWVLPSGTFRFWVGWSSRDLPLMGTLY